MLTYRHMGDMKTAPETTILTPSFASPQHDKSSDQIVELT
jgi:hypothetical protein